MEQDKSSQKAATIEALRTELERFTNRRMVTPSDFDFLSKAIQSSTQRPVSPTTLKRVWGYIRDTGEDYSPGRFTLCSLARFIGYRDIEDFEYNRNENSTIQSDHYFGLTMGSTDIPKDAIIEVTWKPDRRIWMLHIEGSEFRIILSKNSKLCIDDIVECHSFTQNAPLYISRVVRENSLPTTYIAGSRSGVHYQIIPGDE